MRKIFLIICLATTLLSCRAQRLIGDKEFNIEGTTYRTKGPYESRLAYDYLIIKNSENKLEGTEAFPGKPKHYYNIDANALIIDKNNFNQLVANEFSPKKLKELLPEKSFTVHLYVSEYGKVLEMFFSVKANTKITAKELAAIDKSLKANFTVSFRDRKSFEGINYFTMYFNPDFSDLLKIKQQQ
jgi:hypothetical protein